MLTCYASLRSLLPHNFFIIPHPLWFVKIFLLILLQLNSLLKLTLSIDKAAKKCYNLLYIAVYKFTWRLL